MTVSVSLALEALASHIEDTYGLEQVSRAHLLEAAKTASEARHTTPDSVLQTSLQDPALLRELAGQVTIGESHFLRHREQLDFAVGRLVKAASSGRRLLVWSAGCSRGEELVSIGMLLMEALGTEARAHVELLGSDLSAASVHTATEGRYSFWSLRGLTEPLRERYLASGPLGHSVLEPLLSWPRFLHLSVQEHLARLGPETVDVLLFRNVGVYIAEGARASLHAEFARVLRPDGVLIQAVTDPIPVLALKRAPGTLAGVFLPSRAGAGAATTSLLSATPEVSFDGERSYRDTLPKPSSDELPQRTESAPTAAAEGAGFTERAGRRRARRPSSLPDTCLPGSRRAPIVTSGGERVRIGPGAVEAQVRGVADWPAVLPHCDASWHASRLADRGNLQEALTAVTRTIEAQPTSGEAYLLRAQLSLNLGNDEGALEDLRAALFIDPANHVARYWRIVALLSVGQRVRAGRELSVLRQSLSELPLERRLDSTHRVDDLAAAVDELMKGIQ